MRNVSSYALLLMLLLVAAPLYGQQKDSPKQLQWWEITTGVLAIPATVIGLVYSYALIRKTRLESRKTELEIVEKEKQLEHLTSEPKLQSEAAIHPGILSRRTQFLILRFIILYLVLRVYGLFEELYNLISGGIMLGLNQLWNIKFDDVPFQIIVYGISYLPKIGYWVIFLAIGWPLFKDINEILGLNLRDFFSIRHRGGA